MFEQNTDKPVVFFHAGVEPSILTALERDVLRECITVFTVVRSVCMDNGKLERELKKLPQRRMTAIMRVRNGEVSKTIAARLHSMPQIDRVIAVGAGEYVVFSRHRGVVLDVFDVDGNGAITLAPQLGSDVVPLDSGIRLGSLHADY